MRSIATAVSFVLLVAATHATTAEIKGNNKIDNTASDLDDLRKLQNDVAELLPGDDTPNFVEAYHHHHRDLEDTDEDKNDDLDGCGLGKDCTEGLTCMKLGLRSLCVPLDCLTDIAKEYRETTLTDAFIQGLFAEAGVTRQDVADAVMAKKKYRKNPIILLADPDNAFSKFTNTFNANTPDMADPLKRSQECMAKAASKQGVTLLIGISYGGGAGIRLDFENTWGTGTADITDSAGGTVTSFVPSAFFGLSVSGFLGLGLDIVATFSWAFTGTKEEIPFSYLIWGARGGFGPHIAVEGFCLFPNQVPGVQLEAGFGAIGGLNLGYKKVWMVFNGTQIADA